MPSASRALSGRVRTAWLTEERFCIMSLWSADPDGCPNLSYRCAATVVADCCSTRRLAPVSQGCSAFTAELDQKRGIELAKSTRNWRWATRQRYSQHKRHETCSWRPTHYRVSSSRPPA